MRRYRVEYRTTIGRIQAHHVTAKNFDDAIDRTVEETGIDFYQVQTVEPGEKV